MLSIGRVFFRAAFQPVARRKTHLAHRTEPLELRLLPAAIWIFDPDTGDLQVNARWRKLRIEIYEEDGLVKSIIDSRHQADTSISAADVTSLKVNGGSLRDQILLGRIDQGSFPNLKSVIVNGHAGDDLIAGSQLSDVLIGEAGSDAIVGNGGDDTIRGGAGADALLGLSGNDWIRGQGNSRDALSGGPGEDTLDGGKGNDHLSESTSAALVLHDDQLSGNGNDSLLNIERAGFGIGSAMIGMSRKHRGELAHTGLHTDFLSSQGMTVDASGFSGEVTLFGSRGDDYIAGGKSRNVLYGGHGDDTLIGGPKRDKLHGGDGADYVDGREADDFIRGYRDNDTVLGGSGNDLLLGGMGEDHVDGGDGNDRIYGQANNDTLTGGNGDDTLIGGGATNVVLEFGESDFTRNGNRLIGRGTDLLNSISEVLIEGGGLLV